MNLCFDRNCTANFSVKNLNMQLLEEDNRELNLILKLKEDGLDHYLEGRIAFIYFIRLVYQLVESMLNNGQRGLIQN